MSKLGSNSHSINPDVWTGDSDPGGEGPPGPPGPPGEVQTIVGGTNVTVDSTDSANPVVNVPIIGGEVDSIVAGTNVTVDNTDPANPVISSTGGGGGTESPLTTKGDIWGYDTDDQRVPVGTDGQMLVADSASSTGLSWQDQPSGGGGGAAVNPSFMYWAVPSNLANNYSSSASATKGGWLTVKKDFTLTGVSWNIDPLSAGSQYRTLIVREDASTPYLITEVIAESEVVTLTDTTAATETPFYFPGGVTITASASQRVGICLQRTDGATTAPATPQFPGDRTATDTEFFDVSEGFRTDENTVPTAPQQWTAAATTLVGSHPGYKLHFTDTTVLQSFISVATFAGGLLLDGETVFQHVADRSFVLPAGLADSQAYADFAATAEATLDIQKNGVSIGTVTFAAASNTGTFTFAAEETFVAGDRLRLVNQGTADATLADVAITIKGAL